MTTNKRKIAATQERELAAALGADLTPGSGSTWHSKDDGRSPCNLDDHARVRFEAKGVAGGVFKLDPRVFLDLENRAISYEATPIVGIRFYRGRLSEVNICVVGSSFPTTARDGIRKTVSIDTKSYSLTPFLVGIDFHTELVWKVAPPRYYRVPRLLVLSQASVERTINELRSS